MDINLMLMQIQNLQEALKCTVCSKVCVNPVKIKVCGHYFCYNCLKVEDHICVKCKTYYEEREIDYNNIAKQCNSLLLELEKSLLEHESKSMEGNMKDTTTVKYDLFTENIFTYDDVTYHVNYVDVLNKVNSKGESALHIACKKNKLDEVITLVKNKNDINAKDFAGWAPLHEAVESEGAEIVETLLENGAWVDVPGGDYTTPLHKAVILENENLIKLLLKYGARKHLIDFFGRKPTENTRNESIKAIFNTEVKCVYKNVQLFCRRKINAYLYYIEEEYKQKLMKSKLVKIIKEYDSKIVTHFFIRKTHKLSLKIMTAMLDGCFLFPQEWIDDFFKKQYFISIPNYTFISKPELNCGIRKAMLNSLLKLPKLFHGISFFIHDHNNPIHIHNIKFSKNNICSLITSGGGKLLHRAPSTSTCEGIFNYPFHANIDGKISRCCHYLIYEEENPPTLQYQMAEIKHKTSKWLIDCIINFTIFD